jgi:hypothetical protein
LENVVAQLVGALLGCVGLLLAPILGVAGGVAVDAQIKAAPPRTDTASYALAHLSVKGRSPMTGYDRDRFGYAWLDADRNGCDTRSDLLGMYLTRKHYRPGTNGCVVESGEEIDDYTGLRLVYVRGATDNIDIDHVVSLGNAWVTGAARWDIKERAALANDPLNLLPVDASANRQKGDGDAATWLPPRRAFRCAYVARQITVKKKYGLWVTAPEKAAMARILATCPEQPLIRDRWQLPTRVTNNITDPGPPGAQGTGGSGSGGPVHLLGPVSYANCDAVRAAGKAPLHRGDPGYSSALDRDGDGVACE